MSLEPLDIFYSNLLSHTLEKGSSTKHILQSFTKDTDCVLQITCLRLDPSLLKVTLITTHALAIPGAPCRISFRIPQNLL